MIDWDGFGDGPGWGRPFGWMWRVLGAIAHVIGTAVIVLVVIGVLVLLIRYLLVATQASQRYLDLNPAPSVTTTASSPSAETPAESAAAKPRTRKPPEAP